MTTKKIGGSIIFGLVIIALATGVLVGRQNKTGGKPLPKFKLSVVTWVGYGPFWLAQEKGYFKDEGVDVDIIVIDDTAQRKSTMINGRVDGLADTVDMLTLSRDEHVPSVAVMQIDYSNGADGIVATDNIMDIRELKGKKIAVQKISPVKLC